MKSKVYLSSLTKTAVLSLILISLSGCLVLRSQMEPGASVNPSKNRLSTKEAQLQQKNAELELKIKNYDEQFRTLLGRIEEMEGKVSESAETKAAQEKVKDLEMALSEMVSQQEALKKEMSDLKKNTDLNSAAAQKVEKPQAKGDLQVAEKYFATGSWTKAVEEFQRFRELNPKSNEIPLVTYKIGVCFQELGMKSEAKTFYNSVMAKYPKDKAAKFAKFRLDSLK